MPLRVENLDDAIVSIVRQIGNAHTILQRENQISISVVEIDVQASLIARGGASSIELVNITTTPTRKSTTDAPEVVEVSTRQDSGKVSSSDDKSQQQSTQDQNQSDEQTQFYGRETLSRTDYKE